MDDAANVTYGARRYDTRRPWLTRDTAHLVLSGAAVYARRHSRMPKRSGVFPGDHALR